MKQLKQIKKLLAYSKVFLFFDYDGVLVPIQNNPSTAYLPKISRNKLVELSQLKNIKVALVSGRDLKTLTKLTRLKNTNIILIGSHGLEMLYKRKRRILFNRDLHILKKIKPKIVSLAKSIAKGFSEDKSYTITYHIRDAKKINLVRKVSNSINKFLKLKSLKSKLKVLEGKNIIEVMPKEVSKGNAVKKVVDLYPKHLYLYFGDDITDISAMKVVKKHKGITVSLNPRLSYKADYLISQSPLIGFINKLKIRR